MTRAAASLEPVVARQSRLRLRGPVEPTVSGACTATEIAACPSLIAQTGGRAGGPNETLFPAAPTSLTRDPVAYVRAWAMLQRGAQRRYHAGPARSFEARRSG